MKYPMLLLIGALQYLPAVGSAQAADSDYVLVNGSGAVAVTPTQARLTLVFSAQQADVAAGKKLVDEQSAAFSAILQQHQIKATDINNAPLVIYPEQRAEKLDQFRVERSTTVLIRDLKIYPALLEAATGLGVSQIQPVELQTADSEQYYTEALQQAFAAAKSKALQLAELSGRKLGKVNQVHEQSSAPGPRFKGMMMAAEAMPVNFGQQQIRADVQVQFELINR
ncbi:SIMPL domain-containing protein [Rheinheimera texasensis]|uniref:SIMPL domain-containing protein n=1 Tax=Rheinheimera texasensis TaxID=306205 RepID=UPI0004E101E3|nr:SIMPL domain-containing protein [Rheinheimera texasensis]